MWSRDTCAGTRRLPRVGLNRAVVVETAIQILNHDGLEALTLAGLASRLGVRPPSLYNHVASLEDLRSGVALRGVSELADRMGTAAIGLARDDALRAIARAYRDFARSNPGLYLAAIAWSLPDDPEHRHQAARAVGTVTRVLASYGLDGNSALHATRALRSALHGFVSLAAIGGFALALDQDASFEWLLKIMTNGLAAGSRHQAAAARS
jgi:AcrR family transcriptional regulator